MTAPSLRSTNSTLAPGGAGVGPPVRPDWDIALEPNPKPPISAIIANAFSFMRLSHDLTTRSDAYFSRPHGYASLSPATARQIVSAAARGSCFVWRLLVIAATSSIKEIIGAIDGVLT